MSQTVSQLIGDEYKEWNGENIIINAPMSSGKTTFVKEELYQFCKYTGKTILWVYNRVALGAEVKGMEDDTFSLSSYQKIQNDIIEVGEEKYTKSYDFIVCDECHYLFTDSWNNKTDVFWQWIKKYAKTVIWMSATGDSTFKIIKKLDKPFKEYSLSPDYSYIKKIIFYDGDNYVEELISSLPKNQKLVYFSKAKKEAHELYLKHKKVSSFVCSQYTDDNFFKNDIDKNFMINGELRKRLLFATSSIDNGINIIDKNLKHIVTDIWGLVTFIQCVGRKRFSYIVGDKNIYENDIILHIRNWNKVELTRQLNLKRAVINEADKILNKDKNFIKKLHQERNVKVNSCFWIDYEKFHFIELKYEQHKILIKDTEEAIRMGFNNFILYHLPKFNGEVEYISEKDKIKKEKNSHLQELLKSLVGKELSKDEMKDLIKGIDYKFNGRLIRRIENINSELELNNIPYKIQKNVKKIRIVNKPTTKTYYIIKENFRE